MVRGLDKFKDYFRDFPHSYIVIGGTACELLLAEAGLTARATKRRRPRKVIYTASNGGVGLKFMEESKQGVRDFPSVIIPDLSMPRVEWFRFLGNYNPIITVPR